MANRYWVGGAGWWGQTTHWSTTSGGASGAAVPTSADDVFFDANSGAGVKSFLDADGNETSTVCNNFTVTANGPAGGASYSAYTHTVYGNYSAAMNTSLNYIIVFAGVSGTKTIDFKTSTLGNVTFQGGATYQLQSNANVMAGDEGSNFYIKGTCTLDINGYTVTSWNITASETANVIFTGGGTVTAKSTYPAAGFVGKTGSATWDAAKAGTIILDSNGASFACPSFTGDANTVRFIGAAPFDFGYASTFTGKCNTLEINTSAGATYPLTITLGNNSEIGNITTTSTIAAGHIVKTAVSGSIKVNSAAKLRPDYLTFTSMNVGAGGPILAGANCVNGGSNVGVLFGKKLPGFGAML